ncbi:MAG: hypothetical protein ACRDJW_21625 [Thermomicrobiales bacterium]
MVRDDKPPEDVGESITRRGEDIVKEEGKEAGREDAGMQGPTERPVGTSTARDSTGIAPQEPIDEESPD